MYVVLMILPVFRLGFGMTYVVLCCHEKERDSLDWHGLNQANTVKLH